MKTTTIVLAAWFVGASASGAPAGEAEPPLRAAEGLFDLSNKKSLGLETVPGEHVQLFKATDEGGYRFSHHPGLVLFQGQLFCSWSNGIRHEDRPAQRVLYSHSADGRKWSPPQVLAAPTGKQDGCIAAGFLVAGKTLVAYYTLRHDYPIHNLHHPKNGLFAITSSDGRRWSEPRRVATGFFIEAPKRLPGGRLLLGGEHVGPRWKSNQARMNLLVSDDPTGLSDWRQAAISPADAQPNGITVFGYTEPCPFARRDGLIVAPFRNSSGFLYASTSQDNGLTWTVPRKTNFPDSTARFCTGQLPDGRIFLINNPGPGRLNRGLLTIALSDDGVTFDRAWLIRGEPTKQRFVGKQKLDGWQYPNALVWNESLYVAYSVNKEDVWLTRISLSELK